MCDYWTILVTNYFVEFIYFIKSVLFFLAQNHNHIASVGFTISTVSDILCT